MSLQHTLIETLLDGRFHSGEQLASSLGVTRAAIWKHVKALQKDYGLDIHAVTGKGYRLSQSFELINHDVISEIVSKTYTDIEIETHISINSTNHYLMHENTSEPVQCKVVFAEQQTSGRGRRGRSWISPFGGNLYFSIRYQFNPSPSDMTGLSLAVGVAIVELLRDMGVATAGLKWPNDILVNDQKLCGILIEMHGESHGAYTVVIGIGLNLSMSPEDARQIDQPWVALDQICDIEVSRNELAANLLLQIISALKTFESQGLEPFRDRWMRWDCYMDSEVSLRLGEREIKGIAKGIDQQGALLIDHQGQRQRFYSGEISLRPVKRA